MVGLARCLQVAGICIILSSVVSAELQCYVCEDCNNEADLDNTEYCSIEPYIECEAIKFQSYIGPLLETSEVDDDIKNITMDHVTDNKNTILDRVTAVSNSSSKKRRALAEEKCYEFIKTIGGKKTISRGCYSTHVEHKCKEEKATAGKSKKVKCRFCDTDLCNNGGVDASTTMTDRTITAKSGCQEIKFRMGVIYLFFIYVILAIFRM